MSRKKPAKKEPTPLLPDAWYLKNAPTIDTVEQVYGEERRKCTKCARWTSKSWTLCDWCHS